MPTNRRRIARPIVPTVTDAAVACWKQGDYWGLWRELHLKLWQMPDWNEDPVETDDRPEYMRRAYPAPDPRALKPILLELAGPPPERWYFKRDDAGRFVDDDNADE